MTIIRNTNRSVWCDYCKSRWSTNSIKGQTPAVITIKSEYYKSKQKYRNLCQNCINDVENWETGRWTIAEQIASLSGVEELDYGF